MTRDPKQAFFSDFCHAQLEGSGNAGKEKEPTCCICDLVLVFNTCVPKKSYRMRNSTVSFSSIAMNYADIVMSL